MSKFIQKIYDFVCKDKLHKTLEDNPFRIFSRLLYKKKTDKTVNI